MLDHRQLSGADAAPGAGRAVEQGGARRPHEPQVVARPTTHDQHVPSGCGATSCAASGGVSVHGLESVGVNRVTTPVGPTPYTAAPSAERSAVSLTVGAGVTVPVRSSIRRGAPRESTTTTRPRHRRTRAHERSQARTVRGPNGGIEALVVEDARVTAGPRNAQHDGLRAPRRRRRTDWLGWRGSGWLAADRLRCTPRERAPSPRTRMIARAQCTMAQRVASSE